MSQCGVEASERPAASTDDDRSDERDHGEIAVSFTASAVQACYLDSYTIREMLSEAKTQRDDAWSAQVKKAKDELAELEKSAKDKDKDKEKKISALRKRLENLEGACTSLQDGESKITKVQDGSWRLYLKETDRSAVDADGKTFMDITDVLARAFARTQFMAERLEMMLLISYVEPDTDPAYIRYRALQDQLESHHRRVLSVQGRMAAQAKKEEGEGGKSSLEQEQAEIDKLKGELSEAKNMS